MFWTLKINKEDDIRVCASMWTKAWCLINSKDPAKMTRDDDKQCVIEFVSKIQGFWLFLLARRTPGLNRSVSFVTPSFTARCKTGLM
ncbi:hypothetical protein FKM82_009134 [Ascaphus truei]